MSIKKLKFVTSYIQRNHVHKSFYKAFRSDTSDLRQLVLKTKKLLTRSYLY